MYESESYHKPGAPPGVAGAIHFPLGSIGIRVCAEFVEGGGQIQNTEQGMRSNKKRKVDG